MIESRVLDYSPTADANARRVSLHKYVRRSLIVLIALMPFSLLFIPMRSDEVWMNAITGSTRKQIYWPRRFTFGPTFQTSSFELRLKKRGITWTPTWQFVCGPERTLFGSTTCNVCDRVPPIYYSNPVMGDFADVSSDAELRQFVAVMQTGTDAQKQAAADAAFKKGLEAMKYPSGQ